MRKLLPTVLAKDYDGGATPGNLCRDTTPLKAIEALLPTPNAGLGEHRRDLGQPPERRREGGHQVSLADIACHNLLPTVTTSDTNGIGEHGNGGLDLRATVATTDFGGYTAAIRRWEQVLGRPAPPPTELSPRGRHRLSEHFTEWMMGLPQGWICDTPGITRRDAIKAAGNGVVPAQATAALQDVLQHVPATKEAA